MQALRSRRRRWSGLTLVELMVAMALMTVLTGTIVFIFTQAQNIFQQVDAKVQVYQYARGAFDQMERDLANVQVTCDMDFFQDLNKDGHFEDGEQLNSGAGIDGTEEVMLRPPYNQGFNDVTRPPFNYHYGVTLRSPKYYQDVTDKTKYHAHDSIYFKSITQFQGQTSPALVEYALTDLNRERPKLEKRLWIVTGIDTSQNPPKMLVNQPPLGTNTPTSTLPIKQDLCLYVTDVNFQFFIKDKRRGDPSLGPDRFSPGTFYSAEELVSARPDPVTNNPPFPMFRNFWNGMPNKQPLQPNQLGQASYMVMCYYDRWHMTSGDDPASFTVTDSGKMHTQSQFDFPMMSPGDRLYVFGWSPQGTSGGAGGGAQQQQGIPPGDYTIKRIAPPQGAPLPPSSWLVEFNEHFSTVGVQNFVSDNYSYRAGWLPPAVRCTLRIKDAKAKEIRTISRTFKVLSSS
jgi:type II secretory pathway pseudopilin PulG